MMGLNPSAQCQSVEEPLSPVEAHFRAPVIGSKWELPLRLYSAVNYESVQLLIVVQDTNFLLFLHNESFGNVSVKKVSSILRFTF